MGGDPRGKTGARASEKSFYVGIEGGGTRTIALVADSNGQILDRVELPPLNLQLVSNAAILSAMNKTRSVFPGKRPAAISICLAGCRNEADRKRVNALIDRAWPRIPRHVGSDLDSAHAAAFDRAGAGIVIISGTGSCVYGRIGKKSAKAGAWGHLLGDHGSGYWIAIAALRLALRDYDRSGKITATIQKILRRLCLNSPDDLVNWIQQAKKPEIAALAPEIANDYPAVLSEAAEQLTADCVAVANRLGIAQPVQVALTGGVFANNRKFFKLTARKIQQQLPGARICRPKCDSAVGALMLARPDVSIQPPPSTGNRNLATALTEQRNPRTLNIHRQSISQLIDTMLSEESRVVPALRRRKRDIEGAIRAIVASFKGGGRLFYVGAGTSGRLGVLDASECPPTFSTDPLMVQGIIAGGQTALHSAVEAAEDSRSAGAEAIRDRCVNKKDVVVGIAASGSTPFVIGALDAARQCRARTFLLCFSQPPPTPHRVLFIRTGPEALTGSTRLKAGTATKLVLNMLTTISLIRLGKVVSNLMVDVRPNSEKLRERACRIVATLRDCSGEEARARLVRAKWNMKRALR